MHVPKKVLAETAPVEKVLTEKIVAAFYPVHFELENESHQHAVPTGSETHFRAVIVSTVFEGLARIDRQRQVLRAIEHELKNGVHAFTMRALTPAEWEAGNNAKNNAKFESPPCFGGSKERK